MTNEEFWSLPEDRRRAYVAQKEFDSTLIRPYQNSETVGPEIHSSHS